MGLSLKSMNEESILSVNIDHSHQITLEKYFFIFNNGLIELKNLCIYIKEQAFLDQDKTIIFKIRLLLCQRIDVHDQIIN
ncbi:hypothetical protein BpHYR1_029872 [Brachionus plicatilis]|uniref:Uncharacterized protein n=1 Tax=Brachionus plicatilis TaxID=10195 RepID=A0A3M7SIP9_BRAPC|nr:hypothetical protein BpHYR1_029872 [Brachionus plicatilis]